MSANTRSGMPASPYSVCTKQKETCAQHPCHVKEPKWIQSLSHLKRKREENVTTPQLKEGTDRRLGGTKRCRQKCPKCCSPIRVVGELQSSHHVVGMLNRERVFCQVGYSPASSDIMKELPPRPAGMSRHLQEEQKKQVQPMQQWKGEEKNLEECLAAG